MNINNSASKIATKSPAKPAGMGKKIPASTPAPPASAGKKPANTLKVVSKSSSAPPVSSGAVSQEAKKRGIISLSLCL